MRSWRLLAFLKEKIGHSFSLCWLYLEESHISTVGFNWGLPGWILRKASSIFAAECRSRTEHGKWAFSDYRQNEGTEQELTSHSFCYDTDPTQAAATCIFDLLRPGSCWRPSYSLSFASIQGCTLSNRIRPYFSLFSKSHASTSSQIYKLVLEHACPSHQLAFCPIIP